MSWWVYLLVVGLVLIIIAALNENYKKEDSMIKERLLSMKFFRVWDW